MPEKQSLGNLFVECMPISFIANRQNLTLAFGDPKMMGTEPTRKGRQNFSVM